MKDNSTGKNKDFYDLGKKMFDRLNPHIAHNPKVVGPDQEPVAWMTQARNFVHPSECTKSEAELYGWKPVYTSPPQRQPCQTCESLARAVMMDQTGRDA